MQGEGLVTHLHLTLVPDQHLGAEQQPGVLAHRLFGRCCCCCWTAGLLLSPSLCVVHLHRRVCRCTCFGVCCRPSRHRLVLVCHPGAAKLLMEQATSFFYHACTHPFSTGVACEGFVGDGGMSGVGGGDRQCTGANPKGRVEQLRRGGKGYGHFV